MLKIIFMNLNYEVFLVMMFSENNDDCYLSNKAVSYTHLHLLKRVCTLPIRFTQIFLFFYPGSNVPP